MNKHDEYIKNYQSGINRTHITGWLEYFAESLQALLLDVWENLKAPPASPADKSMELSDRQKKILRLLDEPSSVITNRQVQDLFGISQITASRDLAKMAGLGILFAHGKGRSVRYSKV